MGSQITEKKLYKKKIYRKTITTEQIIWVTHADVHNSDPFSGKTNWNCPAPPRLPSLLPAFIIVSDTAKDSLSEIGHKMKDSIFLMQRLP